MPTRRTRCLRRWGCSSRAGGGTADDRTPHGELEVNRSEFAEALTLLTRKAAGQLSGQRAVLRFADGELCIALGDRSTGAGARGDWPGSAALHPNGLRGLLKALPDGPVVTLVDEDGWVRIGSTSVGSVWTGPGTVQIEIPLNPTTGDLLRLNATHGPAAVEAAGLRGPIEDAMAEFDAVLEKVSALVGPLGISRDDVEGWMKSASGLGEPSEGGLGPAQRGLALDVDGEQHILGED